VLRVLPSLVALLVTAFLPSFAAALDARLVPAFEESSGRDPASSRGVVVWSHGRSLDAEEMQSRTPLYLRVMRDAGWDVVRFERKRVGDTLPASSAELARRAEELKGQGYRRVVLAGQSFGAFLSLMAAGRTDAVDTVLATAPAAFGTHADSFQTWRLNATQLYAVLGEVRRARVALFFFHGDAFDPGGRADRSAEILARRGVETLVVDQPADLPGHNVAATGLFARRFGACLARFAEGGRVPTAEECEQPWGDAPGPEIAAPLPLTVSLASSRPRHPLERRWHGFYVNGREILLTVDSVEGSRVRATYALGPGVDPEHAPEAVSRVGRLDGDELVFDEPGRNPLRFKPRYDGRLAGTWSEVEGGARLTTVLRPLD
jgi:dienelactone hydrolase